MRSLTQAWIGPEEIVFAGSFDLLAVADFDDGLVEDWCNKPKNNLAAFGHSVPGWAGLRGSLGWGWRGWGWGWGSDFLDERSEPSCHNAAFGDVAAAGVEALPLRPVDLLVGLRGILLLALACHDLLGPAFFPMLVSSERFASLCNANWDHDPMWDPQSKIRSPSRRKSATSKHRP